MENSFKAIIEKSESILILLPTKPYFDQAAAGLSLYLALQGEKQVQISSPSPMTVEFNRLIGVNKITQDLGNKNLVIRFKDYKANDIERVSYDIEDSQFRLTVIPKSQVNPPTKEQVDLSYSGVAASTVIIIGGANESHFPAINSEDLAGANLVHIGTRDISFSSGKSFISFSRPASSVSEVVYSLIKEAGMTVDQDIASNILMGMEKASNDFTSSEVNSETFAVISELMRAGGKRKSQISPPQGSYPPGSIPGQMPRMTQAQALQYQRQLQQQMLRQQSALPQSTYPMAQYPQAQNLPQTQYPQQQAHQGDYYQSQQAQQQSVQQAVPNQYPNARQVTSQTYQSPQQPQHSQKQAQAQQEIKSEKIEKKEVKDEVPQDWLEPRIYKGTSVN